MSNRDVVTTTTTSSRDPVEPVARLLMSRQRGTMSTRYRVLGIVASRLNGGSKTLNNGFHGKLSCSGRLVRVTSATAALLKLLTSAKAAMANARRDYDAYRGREFLIMPMPCR